MARPWRRAAEAFALSEETPPIERGRPPPLHMGRKRELVRLLRDFAQQHEDGVCRVKSFRHLLRLEYPKACKEDLKAMLDFVGTMTDFEAAATEAAKARKEEVEQIFRAIDFDASGSIDEKEFVENLLQSAQDHGMGRDALVKLFRAKDVDGSGTLDMSEFVELVNESDLFNHRAAIIQQGEQARPPARAPRPRTRPPRGAPPHARPPHARRPRTPAPPHAGPPSARARASSLLVVRAGERHPPADGERARRRVEDRAA